MAKKEINSGLIIAGIVTIVLIILQKKRVFDSMDLRPSFPRNFVYKLPSNVEFDLPFTAFNASNGSLRLGSLDLRLYAENQYIGRAYATNPQTIFPSGQSVLGTRVIVSLIDLITAVPGFVAGVQDNIVNWNLQGTVNVEGFYVPLNIPLRFNLPKI